MLKVTTLYAVDPATAKAMYTDALRRNFHIGGMFAPGEIRLTYTHYDRMIVGGAVPGGKALVLDDVRECGTASILERREMGNLNIGDAATVQAGDNVDYRDVEMLGMEDLR